VRRVDDQATAIKQPRLAAAREHLRDSCAKIELFAKRTHCA